MFKSDLLHHCHCHYHQLFSACFIGAMCVHDAHAQYVLHVYQEAGDLGPVVTVAMPTVGMAISSAQISDFILRIMPDWNKNPSKFDVQRQLLAETTIQSLDSQVGLFRRVSLFSKLFDLFGLMLAPGPNNSNSSSFFCFLQLALNIIKI